jgi:hypothetical protein
VDLLTREDLKIPLTEPRKPCVSIFMPTHRGAGVHEGLMGQVLW